MKRTKIAFDIGTVPCAMRPYLEQATIYDSSCSEAATTLFVEGAERAFLKICAGSLERECRMTRFMHGLGLAPNVIAYESDGERDYLLTEAVTGQDGAEAVHLEQPDRLASVFGESLRMLHSLPVDGCPYPHRTAEMLEEASGKGIDPGLMHRLKNFTGDDDVLIHGDYCLPNVILDRFSFRSFIDVGNGGVGDRHFDLYWGLWTLRYNLKTDRYHERFLDAYGRQDVDADRLADFTSFIEQSA